jgi:ribosome maturation factor RimP
MVKEKLSKYLEEKLSEEDFNHCFPIEIKEVNSTFYQVFLDSDTGITFTECRKISRFLESIIETEGLLPQRYKLEVSSPGADRPLTIARQYTKHIGRELEVKLTDGNNLKGELKEVKDDGLTLNLDSKNNIIKHFLWEDIEESKVIIKF